MTTQKKMGLQTVLVMTMFSSLAPMHSNAHVFTPRKLSNEPHDQAQLTAAKDALETKLRKAEEKKAQDALRAKQREEELMKREADDKAKADASFFSRVTNFFSSDKDKQETKQVLSSFLKRRPSMADVQGKFSPLKP
jgi:hypothetical protein